MCVAIFKCCCGGDMKNFLCIGYPKLIELKNGAEYDIYMYHMEPDAFNDH